MASSKTRSPHGGELHKKGFRKGDVFGIFSTNCPEYGIAFHAVAMLGGISTLVNPLYTAEEAAFQLNTQRPGFSSPRRNLLTRRARRRSSQRLKSFSSLVRRKTPHRSIRLQSDGNVPRVEINPRADLVALAYFQWYYGTAQRRHAHALQPGGNMRQMDGLEYFTRDDTLLCVCRYFISMVWSSCSTWDCTWARRL